MPVSIKNKKSGYTSVFFIYNSYIIYIFISTQFYYSMEIEIPNPALFFHPISTYALCNTQFYINFKRIGINLYGRRLKTEPLISNRTYLLTHLVCAATCHNIIIYRFMLPKYHRIYHKNSMPPRYNHNIGVRVLNPYYNPYIDQLVWFE